MGTVTLDPALRLNAISPYFTMFPLDFPLSILNEHAQPGDHVLDPFCGRGTTNFAARTLGLSTFGIDSSPVAVATAQAKLVMASPEMIVRAASKILAECNKPSSVPQGEFWETAFDAQVLSDLCSLRESLLRSCDSASRVALRGVLLGALHGPLKKHGGSSYLSNQCPRTYAPKPAYAVRYWRKNGLVAPKVNVLEIVSDRSERYYRHPLEKALGKIVRADSRHRSAYRWFSGARKAQWAITSPPYYGMRTYIPDQWLRNWFVGGPSSVDYSNREQLSHANPKAFAEQLRSVWQNMSRICDTNARLVVRFGGISDRKADPRTILLDSLKNSGWLVNDVSSAGTASSGKRQADHFLVKDSNPVEEWDLWATSVS